jgi:alkylation response protein AidB-like acyl-CoA dehydrogenase
VDFDDSADEAAFRAQCRTWLDEHASLRPETGRAELWKLLRPRSDEDDRLGIETAKLWQSRKADAGYAGIHWPVEYGGRGLSAIMAGIFKEEEDRYDVPANSFQVGIDMVGPTLIAHGTDAQQRTHLNEVRSGKEVWCQMFSEPEAGSDLAGLQCRADRDGDEFVVNGQKVWSSGSHSADWGILLVRTDREGPKHHGITYLLLDMSTPGVEVRPLRQIDGASHFSEVFFTDVRVPVANVVGEIDDGWRVAMTTLTSERSAIGGGGMVQFREIVLLARQMGVEHDPVIRQRLARMHTLFEISRFLGYRVRTAVSRGEVPGAESSVIKLHISRQYEEGGDAFLEMLGAHGMLWHDDAPFDGWFVDLFLAQWAPRIGGGTDQIQRNIVGERVLGLPKEPRS